jgi:flavin-binding protein dodecin
MMEPMMLIRAILSAAVVFAVAGNAHANRKAGAHQHGSGALNIAIEGNKVAMEFEAPGADIVGFEHEAKTDAQKAAIAKATDTLKDALAVFTFPAEAQCKITQANVTLEGKQDAKDKHGHGKGEAHSEFKGRYELECAVPARLTAIEFKYFELFKGAERLKVNLSSPKGQNQFQVTRRKPKLTLGATS